MQGLAVEVRPHSGQKLLRQLTILDSLYILLLTLLS